MKRFYCASPIVFSFALVVLAGCGGDPRAKVSGKVTYKDKPLPGGTVVFVTEDDLKQDRVPIGPDGSYTSNNVPVGNLRVAVEPAPKGAAANMPKGAKRPEIPADSPAAAMYGKSGGEYVDIPQKLRNPSTSEIKHRVEPGEQTFDIHLKDSK